MRKIMAVWDTNPLYAERLADFANERGRIPFRAVAFASADRLKEYAAKHSVEILLAGSDAPAVEVKEVRAGRSSIWERKNGRTRRSCRPCTSTRIQTA